MLLVFDFFPDIYFDNFVFDMVERRSVLSAVLF